MTSLDPKASSAAPAISRRTVLGAAAAGSVGVAAGRLLGFAAPRVVMLENGAVTRTGLDWVSPMDRESAKVAHLLRRTTFGATAAQLDAAASDGYARTVERLLETPAAEPPALEGAEEASALKPLRVGAMQEWWVSWMLASPTPFIERMTLFWHGHFTSDFRKVGPQSPYLYWQNLTWRKFALDDLKTMLAGVTLDPAMLVYLDLAQSTGRNPNENYSRELMELFAMGAGTFTENDVKNGARALSGWRQPLTRQMVDAQVQRQMMRTGMAPSRVPPVDAVKTGVPDPRRAYAGPALTILGKTQARWDVVSVVDQILAQEVTAPFVARKLVSQFVQPYPEEAYVQRLAKRFRESRYAVKALMRDILTSPEFTAAVAYRTLVKSPTEFMVHTARALESPPLVRLVVQSGQGMGQSLFDPPEVGGWPNNESWVSSSNLLARVNFVAAALKQARRRPSVDEFVKRDLDGVVSPQTAKLLNETPGDETRWLYALASPEFQLK